MLHWLFDPDPLTRSLIWISLMLLVSVIVSKGAGRFGIPGFLVFLAIGMAAGTHGPGGLALANYEIAKTVGVFALIAILHSGGLSTPMADVRRVRGSGLVLASLGTVITALLVSWFSVVVLGIGALPGFLLGATIACTDVAAVFTILRAKRVSLAGRLRPLLEIESALNDPMAVFLSVGALALIMHPGQNGVASLLGLIPSFFRQMIFGTAVGIAAGRATAWAARSAGGWSSS